jgi:hypothetical protein
MQNFLPRCKNWLPNILGKKLHKKLLAYVNKYNITYLPKSNLYLTENKLCLPDLKLLEDIPIRQEIEILGPDIPKSESFDHNFIVITPRKQIYQKTMAQRQLKLGWSIQETIGISMVNPRAVSKLNIKTENSDE